MEQYIDKDTLVAEINRVLNSYHPTEITSGRYALKHILDFLDTIEVKELNTWHLQEKEDIYDAIKGWGIYTFACLMTDGTVQKFTGHLDEDYEGNINTHIYGVNDGYDNVNDIVKWIEIN